MEGLWKTEALNYETKIAIVILCSFSAGFTIQKALSRVGGAIGGGIGGYLSAIKPALNKEDLQPWRNPVWRSLLKAYLGQSAPEDIQRISDEVLQKQIELINLTEPDERERANKAIAATTEKMTSDLVDNQWATWWVQFHVPSLLRAHSPFAIMSDSLSGNFHSASLILIFAMPWTPELRYWWIVVFCLYWIIDLASQMVYLFRSGSDLWSSFNDQLEFLQARKSVGGLNTE